MSNSTEGDLSHSFDSGKTEDTPSTGVSVFKGKHVSTNYYVLRSHMDEYVR